MMKKRWLALAVLAAALTVVPAAAPAQAKTNKTTAAQEDHWSGSSYIKNGKKVTGLQTIGKKQYVFSTKGKLIKNKICYTVKENGTARYFDINTKGVAKEWTGVYAMAAKQLVSMKAVPSKATDKKRTASLKKAFLWSANLKKANPNKEGLTTAQALKFYGEYGFQRGAGECVAQAATFTAMAKVLRYDAKLMIGYVMTVDGLSEHAWTQIKLGKTSYAYDPNFNTWSFVAELRKTNKYLGYQFTYGSKNTLKYYNAKKKLLQ